MMLIHQMLDAMEDESDAELDEEGVTFRRERARSDNRPPEDLLATLQVLRVQDNLTIWASPTYRALLMATQGASVTTFFHDQDVYRRAEAAARQGQLPAAWTREPADEIGGPQARARGWTP